MIKVQRELEAKRKDGSTFPILLGLNEVQGPGGTPIFVSFIQDLSDQKKVNSLERSKAAAEALLRSSVTDDLMKFGSDDYGDDELLIATVLYAEIVAPNDSLGASNASIDAT
eukprot:1660715-Ditylum_brightwellii.AAC.1